MRKQIHFNIGLLFMGFLLFSCKKEAAEPCPIVKKEFVSSFETADDFSGFYLTPQGHLGTTFHELSDSIVKSGSFAHKAWISGANPPSTSSINNNHRGYPTIQLQNTPEGVFTTPCYISLSVWADIDLQADPTGGDDDWLSFATFTDDETNAWNRTVLVNLSQTGFVHLQHVPVQGEQTHIFQTSSLPFPQKEWVDLKIYLDFRENGYSKVWQNGQLVSHAKLNNLENKLSQIHFGMYAPPQITNGIVFNDDLKIIEVDGE